MTDFRCQQPCQRVQIRSTGEVCPCCAFVSSELTLGNIGNKTIYGYSAVKLLLYSTNGFKKCAKIKMFENF